jgi:TATA-binding protein-associated factor
MLVHIKKRVKGGVDGAKGGEEEGNVLKYLLYLRLLCVHPILVAGNGGSGGGTDKKDEDEDDDEDIFGSKDRKNRYSKLEDSGKLSVLMELLVSSGIVADDRVTAADADTSSIFVDVDTVEGIMDIEDEENEKPGEEGEDGQEENKEEVEEDEVVDGGALDAVRKRRDGKPNKCLIFAQHTKALDVVEEYLFRPHLPSLNYLRLDGRKPANKRFEISEAFNRDDDIRVLLLTTKIGGLGLNLTGANVVIFLEHDYNPVNDLQAMDRAHRIGQKECVSVYRLVTRNSIDERIMASQRAKVAMGDAIVTSDNSSMFAMGTERLLDLFDLEEVEEVGNAGVEEGVVDELWAGMKDEDRIVEEERGDFDHLNVESFMDEREESVKG